MRLGVCYYPEHWPESWWERDAQEMLAMGIKQVRLAEFAWSRIEPEAGKFEWAWLDRAVEILANAGLKIVMCTPTATPPKWLIDKQPSILAVDKNGHPRRFGSRRHYDFSSEIYFAQAARITRAMGERYGLNPAVVAWQTDNEYGCHDTVISYSGNAIKRFRWWLLERYGDIDRLNLAWGAVFWSQEYRTFDEIDSPNETVTEANPTHRLDYRRFASDEVLRFNRQQCGILRQLSPGRGITHNFMQLFTDFDHHHVAADLDIAAWDSYPLGALEMFWFSAADKQRWLRTGHPDFAAFHHDLYRGMSKQPFWVMEQQPGPVNWASWNPVPAPGMVRLWTWEAFAHGADVVSYFRWRQAPFGQEQMHAGLQTSDRRVAAGALEVARVAQEIDDIPHESTRPARVALVFDYPSIWITDIQPQGADYNALQLAFEAYSALRSLGLDIDVVASDSDLSAYALIVLPAQPIVTAQLLAALTVSTAQIVLYPRAGSKDINAHIPANLPPGSLQSLIDVRVTRVASLRPDALMPLSYKGNRYAAKRWCEDVEVGPNTDVLAQFDDGSPAVAQSGRVRYLTAWFSEDLQSRLLEAAALDAGLCPVLLPSGLRVRRRGDLLFVFNYSDSPLRIAVAQSQWLLGGADVSPQGLSIARRLEEK